MIKLLAIICAATVSMAACAKEEPKPVPAVKAPAVIDCKLPENAKLKECVKPVQPSIKPEIKVPKITRPAPDSVKKKAEANQ